MYYQNNGEITLLASGKEEAMTFQSLGKIEESRLKEGSRKENQAFATMSGKKGRFSKFGHQNKRINVEKT